MFKKMGLASKLALISIITILCFVMVYPWLYTRFKSTMYDSKYKLTQHLVESSWAIIDRYVKEAESGRVDEETAKKSALADIAALRYDGSNYFWVNDSSPTMVMHPMKPALDGTDLSGLADPNGKKLFVEMANVCKANGEGVVEYFWSKPGSEEPVPKVSYVKLHKKWDWIVGTGVYIDDISAEINAVVYRVVVVVVTIVVLVIIITYFVGRSITRPIEKIISGLSHASKQLGSASDHVSSSSQQMAEGSSESASSLEEISASIEELTSMTKQNTDNTKQMSSLMSDSKQLVGNGQSSMQQLTNAMEGIKASSDETSKIIKTIDEIAFQTNLLALNAAVEAARAGEAGKGFAVVAEEVRNLAQRSAEAAKNTSSLIEDAINNSENGVGLANQAAQALNEITESSNSVATLVDEVSLATEEQAKGIEQINVGISQMNKVTQSNAANAEESASASEELSAQAHELNSMIGVLVDVIRGSHKDGEGHQIGGISNRNSFKSNPTKKTFRDQNPKTDTKGILSKKVDPVVKPERVIPLDDSEFGDF